MPKKAARKAPKQTEKSLADLANVGPATLGDFRVLGISTLPQLAEQDAFELYERLCKLTKARHDPCCIDVFMATIAEARGGKPTAWWKFTPKRKAILAKQEVEALKPRRGR